MCNCMIQLFKTVFLVGCILATGFIIYGMYKDEVDKGIINLSTNNSIERAKIINVRNINGDWLQLVYTNFINYFIKIKN